MSNDQDLPLTHIGFLSRLKLYQEVKPYGLRFTPPGDLPQTNINGNLVPITIGNARLRDQLFQACGFGLFPFTTTMPYQDFDDPIKVKHIYCSELASAISSLLGVRHVRILDYSIRRRDAAFPISTGTNFTHSQPANMAHIDFTPDEAVRIIQILYGPRANEVISQGWAIVNAWRPLKGPVHDWPLAVCDRRTFAPEQDSIAADVVYRNWFSEDVLVHYNVKQEWFFYPEQQVNELLLFQSVDSKNGLKAACPHAAFGNPAASLDMSLRESIDCRALILLTEAAKLPPETGILLYGTE
ncbi:hypothetical protein F4859DRAFT_473218 [Xylaria cf. heliscus]|nr:hypothetical protein F4859DRAFT_473218 [Xylaria cf. heliscus]